MATDFHTLTIPYNEFSRYINLNNMAYSNVTVGSCLKNMRTIDSFV